MMAADNDDLGLSLTLASPVVAESLIKPTAAEVPSMFFHQRSPHFYRPSLLPHSDGDARPFLKGIDVNRLPEGGRESEDDGDASSPNSTLSSFVSGKRNLGGATHLAGGGSGEGDGDLPCSRSGGSDDEDGGVGSRKKLRLSKEQSAILEESFKEHNTLNPKEKLALAKQLNLRPRQVEVWFQNRRARTKLKQTEVDCEFLKRCCENLTEENQRLQKELAELRVLKLSPQFYMQMKPPTTLTMCPSCERVQQGHPQSSSSSPAAPPDLRRPLVASAAPSASPAPWPPIPILSSFVHAPSPRS